MEFIKVVGLIVSAILICGGVAMTIWCMAVPEDTPEEQEQEDEDQWDYLQKRRSQILKKEKKK